MHRHLKFPLGIQAFVILLLACAVLFTSVSSAYATGSPSTPTTPTTGSGNPARSGDLETANPDGSPKKCTDYGVLTGAMVPCIMYTIESSGQALAEAFADMLKPVVVSFLTLVVVFFGVKTLQGEGQVDKKAIQLVVKIAFVLAFLQLMPSFIPQVHAIMRENNDIVSSILSDPADFHCDVNKYLKPGGELLWAQMDCVLGKLFGFTTGSGGEPNMLLAASGIGLLGGMLFGGAFGLFVFFALVGVLFTLFQFVMKTVFAYVNGFIIATLLIIIAPLFLPLSLMQVSTQYFDKWWRGILAAILMPVIVTTYVMLALLLYDKVLLADDSIVKKLFDSDYMSELVSTQQACTTAVGNNPHMSEVGAQEDATHPMTPDERAADPNIADQIFPMSSGNNVACIGHPDVNFGQAQFRELFYDLVKLLITTIVISQGFASVQQSVRSITGSSMVSAALDPVSTMEKKMHDAVNSAKSGMQNATDGEHHGQGRRVSDMSGADFVANAPNIIRGGLSPFAGQISRIPE